MHKYLKFAVLAVVALLILWLFGRSLNWTEVWSSLRKADAFQLFLATVIVCLGYLLRAFRWQTLLAPITKSSLRELFATTTVGFAAVFLFGRAAEVVRPLWLPMRDQRVRPSAALVTIGIERICDLVAIALVFAINLLWFRAPAGRESEFVMVNRAGLLILAGTMFGIILLFIFQHFSAPIISIIESFFGKTPLPKRILALFVSLLNHLAASLQILRNPRELALTIMWTAALWFAISLPTWLVINALGLPLSFSDALFVMGVASLGSLVPTPGGGAGAFHLVVKAALVSLSVDPEKAAACAIIMHLVYFAPALIFGFYYFLHGDISWNKFRSLVIAEESESLKHKTKNEKLKIEDQDLNHVSTAH